MKKKNLKELVDGVKKYGEKYMNPTPGDVHVNGPLGKKKKKMDEDGQHDGKTHEIMSVPIFKAGVHKDEAFSIADMDEIVKNTNILIKTDLLHPPVKLGHSEKQGLLQNDGYPAGGYIAQLSRTGDTIFADITDVPDVLYKLIQKRAYNEISSEIYKDFDHPTTKEPMGLVLRAIALLGEDIPEVKGMGDILNLYTSTEMAFITFSEKDLKEDKTMKKWTLKEVEATYPCCSDKVKKYMEENKVTEVPGDKLAEIVTEVNMRKYDDAAAAGADNGEGAVENVKECPQGSKWDEKEQKCVSVNADDKADPEKQKVCPKGYVWSDEQNKCVKAMENNDNKPNVIDDQDTEAKEKLAKKKKAEDVLAGIMKAVGFEIDDKKNVVEQFPSPAQFFEKVSMAYAAAKDMKPEEKKYTESLIKYFASGVPGEMPPGPSVPGMPGTGPHGPAPKMAKMLETEPEMWTDEEKTAADAAYKADKNPNKDAEIEGYPEDKRPPKGWFDKCVASVSSKTDTPEKLCGWIYAHGLSPAAKSKAEATRATEGNTKPEDSDKVKELTEKVRQLTVEKYKEKVKDIVSKNRGVLIPAFDGYIDAFVAAFTEREDKVVKFGEADVRESELFLTFLSKMAASKPIIFSEISRTDKEAADVEAETPTEEEKNKLVKTYTESGKGKRLEGVDVAAYAEKLSKAKNIPYRDAYVQAMKKLSKGGA